MTLKTKTIVRDYGWLHLAVGLLGNILFFVGSILFLPAFEPIRTTGVWLFILRSGLMILGALGQLLVKLREARGAGRRPLPEGLDNPGPGREYPRRQKGAATS